jgi:predicted SAM-dependent methyltransferase
VLEPGGTVRLCVPDLELWAKKYVNHEDSFFCKYRDFFLGGPSCELRTKGDIFMSQIYGWEHQWCYDYQSLSQMLSEAGFIKIGRKTVHESRIHDITVIECADEARVMETLYIEAQKGEQV